MSLSLSNKAKAVKPSSTLAITAKAKELKAKGIDVVGFGAGEPDFNTPDNINQAAIKAINEGFTKYTDASGILELKQAVCNKFKTFNNIDYKPEQIVISNGGKHSLTNIFQAILNPGDEVIIPAPYWLSYPEIVRLADGVPVFIRGEKENGYKVTAKQIADACTEKTKAFVLNSPSNPSGMIYSKEELEEIAKVAVEKDFYVISDEMYEYLVYGDNEVVSIASLNDEIYKRTITCSGVAKSYAMTGWRIGFTASSPEIAKLMSSINGPQEELKLMVEEFDRRRRCMCNLVSEIPYISALEPQGAFYLFIDVSKLFEMSYKGQKINDVGRLASILIEDYNVAVIPCADFGFDDHIRLSYAISTEQIEKGIGRIKKFVSDLS